MWYLIPDGALDSNVPENPTPNPGSPAASMSDAAGPAQFIAADQPEAQPVQDQGTQVSLGASAAGNGGPADSHSPAGQAFAATSQPAGPWALDPKAVDQIDLAAVAKHVFDRVGGLRNM